MNCYDQSRMILKQNSKGSKTVANQSATAAKPRLNISNQGEVRAFFISYGKSAITVKKNQSSGSHGRH